MITQMHKQMTVLAVTQDDDFADDPVMEAYLQLLAVDKSKVACP